MKRAAPLPPTPHATIHIPISHLYRPPHHFLSEKSRKYKLPPSISRSPSLSLFLSASLPASLPSPPLRHLVSSSHTRAYIDMEMRESERESCSVSANTHIQSARPGQKKKVSYFSSVAEKHWRRIYCATADVDVFIMFVYLFVASLREKEILAPRHHVSMLMSHLGCQSQRCCVVLCCVSHHP